VKGKKGGGNESTKEGGEREGKMIRVRKGGKREEGESEDEDNRKKAKR